MHQPLQRLFRVQTRAIKEKQERDRDGHGHVSNVRALPVNWDNDRGNDGDQDQNDQEIRSILEDLLHNSLVLTRFVLTWRSVLPRLALTWCALIRRSFARVGLLRVFSVCRHSENPTCAFSASCPHANFCARPALTCPFLGRHPLITAPRTQFWYLLAVLAGKPNNVVCSLG